MGNMVFNMRIIDILEEFVKEIEKENPYGLVLKGGTALSLFYLNKHRESEDLDFDTDKNNLKKWKDIEKYFIKILEGLKEQRLIKDFKVGKSGLALTNRYHMKLEIETYKKIYTKIDVDFVKLSNVNKRGKLGLYSRERLFIGKLLTFIDRRDFKDLYDFYYLLDKLDTSVFKGNQKVIKLIDDVIKIIEEENILNLYKKAFRNVDLRFKDLKYNELDSFILKLVRKLRVLRNRLKL